MGYSLDPLEADCYPGTGVLINRLNIRDDARLEQAERMITMRRTMQWEIHPLADSFDFAHYKAIHAHLFGDLYDWAGQVRTVDLSKRGTRFCPAREIVSALSCFDSFQ